MGEWEAFRVTVPVLGRPLPCGPGGGGGATGGGAAGGGAAAEAVCGAAGGGGGGTGGGVGGTAEPGSQRGWLGLGEGF